ncbi:MAG: 4-hydroxythreonine-4-phosphate dehydrogenase PdxA, partial [Planctomycetes bacterium]|nr:4-hydroxythreonine-4-phosphate dehydrogenase PdxA [Planctomycetota bacterium]
MSLPRIAVTMGDPAGIGPEVCLKLLTRQTVRDVCVPLLFGDAGVLQRVAGACGLTMPARILTPEDWLAQCRTLREPAVVSFEAIAADSVQPGQVDASTGAASYRYIESAIRSALAGDVAAIATGPIHKEALRAAGVPHPGHTEILAEQTGAPRCCMMLTSSELTCSLVTTHVGYDQVPDLLSSERIL